MQQLFQDVSFDYIVIFFFLKKNNNLFYKYNYVNTCS